MGPGHQLVRSGGWAPCGLPSTLFSDCLGRRLGAEKSSTRPLLEVAADVQDEMDGAGGLSAMNGERSRPERQDPVVGSCLASGIVDQGNRQNGRSSGIGGKVTRPS